MTRQDSTWSAESTSTLTPAEFNSEHHTPILLGEHVYGVRKYRGGQLVCFDLQGMEIWNSGSDRFGHGPYTIADDLILLLDDHGWLTIAEASHNGYERLARYEVFPDGHDAWGPMAIVGGRLVIRDMTRMACLNIAEG